MDGTRWKLWPATILVVIILSFLGANLVGQWQMGVLDEAVIEIATTTTASAEHLATARGEVRNLLAEHRRQEPAAVADARARIDGAIDDYVALPVAPGERQIWRDIIAAKGLLDDTVAAGKDPSVAAGILDTALGSAIEFNARRARTLAVEAREARRGALQTALGLDIACTVIAICGAVLLRRIVRAHDALLDRHRALEAERATELEQFAGRIAHDVMSPLSTVAFALELAKTARRDDERARLLERGSAAVYRVKRMVTGLLDFARAGAKPDPDARADVSAVLSDLAIELEPTAHEAHVELVFARASQMMVACNAGVLTSLVANLTRNALKYIGDGPSRRVEVRAIDCGATVRVEVEDTGPGLPPDIEDRVFDAYARSRSSTQPGVGLGLATVKRLVEGHGGLVGVASVVGKGCTFWFELPKAQRAEPQANPSFSAAREPAINRIGRHRPRDEAPSRC